MSLEVAGKVHKIFDVQQINDTFSKREFVIETDEKYPQFVKFELVKDAIDKIDPYKVGDKINVFFNLRGREWNEKFFTNLHAWKIEGSSVSNEAPKTTPQPEPVIAKKLGVGDDLPFQMIAISGRIAGTDILSVPAYIDILVGSDVSFIGYRVYCTKNTIQLATDTHISLDTTRIIKEESHTLYGFTSDKEKQAFDLLRTASGIGGNTALLILDSIDNVNDLYQAIADSNSAYFVKFKGIGKAKADLIIKGLKKKVEKLIE